MAINLDKTEIFAITVVAILIVAAVAGIVVWNNSNSGTDQPTSSKTEDRNSAYHSQGH